MSNADYRSPKLLVVELNEFNPALLREASARMPLPNLMKIIGMRHAQTTTRDEVEHQGLDPWVQWVGVHTGRPTSEHGIRRLGVTSAQAHPQIWQVVGERGFKWGVWGAMNAPMGSARGCQFFMPDPWSYEEKAYPDYLNDLLALPRYAATNYLEINRKHAFAAALKLARFFLPPDRWLLAAKAAGRLAKACAAAGANVHTFTTLFDYISVLYFTQLRRKNAPDFSLIFLNHIAHLQHQFWVEGDELDPNMALGLRLADEMMGLLLQSRTEGEGLIVVNGMRQLKVAGKGFHVYRQRNPQRAIEGLGVIGGRAEQCMTHDAHIIFDEDAAAERAEEILRSCKLSDGHDAFFVERESARHIFYQLAFDHQVSDDAFITGARGRLRFGDLFELICERTGAHEQGGDVFFDGVFVPDELHNHELFDVMAAHMASAAGSIPRQTAA